MTTTVLNTRISEVENKIPNHDNDVTTPEFNKLQQKVLQQDLNKLI